MAGPFVTQSHFPHDSWSFWDTHTEFLTESHLSLDIEFQIGILPSMVTRHENRVPELRIRDGRTEQHLLRLRGVGSAHRLGG